MTEGNPNQSIFDYTVRHRIALERYSAQDSKRVLKWIEDLKADVLAQMAKATPGRKAQLDRLLEDVASIHDATYSKISKDLRSRWRERAGLEADSQIEKFRFASIEANISRLTTDAAFQAAMSRPMDGAVMSDWLTSMSNGARGRLNKALTISWTEGESLDQAVRRVTDTVEISKRGARTLVRTANTHISNAVQQASAEANSDIIKEVEWRSVLDSRTSPVCVVRDGERYPVDSGPRPPAHPGCRSIVTEILDGFAPPQRETYSEWLNRQPADVQDEVLGPVRGGMLRNGTFKVSQYTDPEGNVIPLKSRAAPAQTAREAERATKASFKAAEARTAASFKAAEKNTSAAFKAAEAKTKPIFKAAEKRTAAAFKAAEAKTNISFKAAEKQAKARFKAAERETQERFRKAERETREKFRKALNAAKD